MSARRKYIRLFPIWSDFRIFENFRNRPGLTMVINVPFYIHPAWVYVRQSLILFPIFEVFFQVSQNPSYMWFLTYLSKIAILKARPRNDYFYGKSWKSYRVNTKIFTKIQEFWNISKFYRYTAYRYSIFFISFYQWKHQKPYSASSGRLLWLILLVYWSWRPVFEYEETFWRVLTF